jgi:phosphoribosylamine---glycine ligase
MRAQLVCISLLTKPGYMNILLLGSGGREHAFAWKIRQSPLCSNLFIAPGNAGTLEHGTNVDIQINDFSSLGRFCRNEEIEIVVVGPEEPLVKGIYDHFKSDSDLQNIIIIGPSAAAAQLEGSKAFAKAFMQRHNIPTANFREFDHSNFAEGVKYIQQHSHPIVLKADGLAAGKGVLICANHIEALAEFELMIHDHKFGDAGKKVVVEEFLSGIEMSVFVLTDGKHYVLLPEAKDYKRIGVGDTGLNTGGMGAISPVPFADETFRKKVVERIIEPTVKGIQEEELEYKGFIFFGIINVGGDPYVIEYNCRMGDPETEVVLPRLQNDVIQLFIATSQQRLNEVKIMEDDRAAATVVAVSGGYPGDYQKGLSIDFGYLFNPEATKAMKENSMFVFHAGTTTTEEGVVTNGGRVLAVTALAENIREAAHRSLDILSQIYYDDMYFRDDIGYEFSQYKQP